MKIQYVGDGTARHQMFTCPRMTLDKWQTITVKTVPAFVAEAPAGTFLIDGKPNPKPKPPVKPKPVKPKPEPKKTEG